MNHTRSDLTALLRRERLVGRARRRGCGSGFSLRALLLVCLGLLSLGSAGAAEQWRWENVDRVVVFGDVHGAYEELTGLLKQVGVIDEKLAWVGGPTHLVSLGDLTDRGPRARDVMDLLMRLQGEAEAAGGAVHVLLGNHETMNLVGNFRYVSQEGYSAFSGDAADLRQKTWTAFIGEFGSEYPDEPSARAEFDRRFPPGYFGRVAAFGADGTYGRWLLDRPILITIDDWTFVHGGLPQMVADLGAESVNRQLLDDLSAYMETWRKILATDPLLIYTPFWTRAETVKLRAEELGAEQLGQLGERLGELTESPIFNVNGPTWYRGDAMCNAIPEIPVTEAALAQLGARYFAIGHTVTPDRRVTWRWRTYENRVLMTDTGMLRSHYRGRPAAVILSGANPEVVYLDESGTQSPAVEQRAIGKRPPGMDDDALEHFLATAEIVNINDIGEGVTKPRKVTLAADGIELNAIFKTEDVGGDNSRTINISDRWQYEVAAYRLDRLIGLDMVPVTVAREIEGETGSLQFWVDEIKSLLDLLEEDESKPEHDKGVWKTGWCNLSDQYNLMYMFDILTYNEDRTLQNIQFIRDGWNVVLIDCSRCFRVLRGRPEEYRPIDIDINDELARRLRLLTQENLVAELGEFIGRSQIRALLRRRDELLKLNQ